MNSPIYSIQREVINNKVSNLALTLCFHKTFFSFDITFFSSDTHNSMFSRRSTDFKCKAQNVVCCVCYFIEAERNTLICYCVSYLYYTSVTFSFWFSIVSSLRFNQSFTGLSFVSNMPCIIT